MTDRAPVTFLAANVPVRASEKYLLPLARPLMSSLFIWDGLLQLRNPSGSAQFFARVHVPVPDLAIWISIPVHLIGGLALLLGFRPLGCRPDGVASWVVLENSHADTELGLAEIRKTQ